MGEFVPPKKLGISGKHMAFQFWPSNNIAWEIRTTDGRVTLQAQGLAPSMVCLTISLLVLTGSQGECCWGWAWTVDPSCVSTEVHCSAVLLCAELG